jgi:hypothetical protein
LAASNKDDEDKRGDDKKGDEKKDEQGGGGGKPSSNSQREKELKRIQNVCNQSEEIYKKFVSLLVEISRVSPNVVGAKDYLYKLNLQITTNLVEKYRGLVRELRNKVPNSSKLSKLYDPDQVQVQIDQYFKGDPNNPNSAKRKSLDFLRKACEAAGKIAKDYYTRETCKRIPGELAKLREAEKSKNERLFECSNIKENAPCTIGAGEVRVNPCDKKNYRCVIKDRDPKVLVYREIK